MPTQVIAFVVHDDQLELLERILRKMGVDVIYMAENLEDAIAIAHAHPEINLFIVDGCFPKTKKSAFKSYDNALHFLDAIASTHAGVEKIAYTMDDHQEYLDALKQKGCQHLCRFGEIPKIFPPVIEKVKAGCA